MLLGIEKKNEMHQNVKNRNAFNFGIINYYDYDYYIAAGRTSSFVSSEIVKCCLLFLPLLLSIPQRRHRKYKLIPK